MTWTRMTVRAILLEKGDRLRYSTGPRAMPSIITDEPYADDFDESVYVKVRKCHWPFEIPRDEPVEIEREVKS